MKIQTNLKAGLLDGNSVSICLGDVSISDVGNAVTDIDVDGGNGNGKGGGGNGGGNNGGMGGGDHHCGC